MIKIALIHLSLVCLFFFSTLTLTVAQDSALIVSNEQMIRSQVLEQIATEQQKRSTELETKIQTLDSRIQTIDDILNQSISEKEAVVRLKERVKILEEKQAAEQSQEFQVYSANYQTAVINLILMERDLKPLQLFQASREFYEGLHQVSNPMNYAEYQSWYRYFDRFLQEEQRDYPILQVTQQALATAGDFSKEFGISNVLSSTLLMSIDRFIDHLSGKKNKDLREQSVEMMQLVTALSLFQSDMTQINEELNHISVNMTDLKSVYNDLLQQTLKELGISESEFQRDFVQETNGEKFRQFLNNLSQRASQHVQQQRKQNPSNWKDDIYFQMQGVQSLKVRFGQSTSNIHHNLDLYKDLIAKYANDPIIGKRVLGLEYQRDKLSDTFNQNFQPEKYISDAVKMYKVY